MVWIIYTRVSTDEQANQGASLPAQLEACTGYLKFSMGIEDVVHISDPGLSAKNLQRPGIQQAMSMIDAGGVEGVCVWKLDRLTRKTMDLLDLVERFKEKEVSLASVQERIDTSGPMGSFMLTVMGAIAQLEREQISERVTFGIRARQREGKWVGGHTMPGVKAVDAEDNGRVLVADDTCADAVAKIWQKVCDGKSLTVIADELAADGVQEKGKPISKQRVSRMIKYERYIGLLVDEDLFNAANERMSKRRRGTRKEVQRHGERTYLLKGLMVCKECGGKMIGSSARGSKDRVYYYYRCINQVNKNLATCTARALPAVEFERFVVEKLSYGLRDEVTLTRQLGKTLVQGEDRRVAVNGDLDALQNERDDLNARIDKLLDFFITENIENQGAFGDKLKVMQADVAELDKQIGGIHGQLAAVDVGADRIKAVSDALAKYGERLMILSDEELAQALPLLVHQVIASVEHLEVQINKPSAVLGAGFECTWYSKRDCEQKITFAWKLATKARSVRGSVIVSAVEIRT